MVHAPRRTDGRRDWRRRRRQQWLLCVVVAVLTSTSGLVNAYQPFTPDLYKRPKYELWVKDAARGSTTTRTTQQHEDWLQRRAAEAEGLPRQSDEARSMVIKNAEGEAFRCQLPLLDPEALEARILGSGAGQDVVSREREVQAMTVGLKTGLDLIKGLVSHGCLYFVQGWWTYSFCYLGTIEQFHTLIPAKGVMEYPPKPDPNSESFTLSKFPTELSLPDTMDRLGEMHSRETGRTEDGSTGREGSIEIKVDQSGWSIGAEIVARPDSTPYLVERWGDGTICLETGLPRITEVQFHCQPGSQDRIASVRETSTCVYLVIINTARLCEADIFRPKPEEAPSQIICEVVGDGAGLSAQKPFVLNGKMTMQGQPNRDASALDVQRLVGEAHARLPPGLKIQPVPAPTPQGVDAPASADQAQTDQVSTLASEIQLKIDQMLKRISPQLAETPSQDILHEFTENAIEVRKITEHFVARGIDTSEGSAGKACIGLGISHHHRSRSMSSVEKRERLKTLAKDGTLTDLKILAILALGPSASTFFDAEAHLSEVYLQAHLKQATLVAQLHGINTQEGSLWDETLKVVHARAHHHLSTREQTPPSHPDL